MRVYKIADIWREVYQLFDTAVVEGHCCLLYTLVYDNEYNYLATKTLNPKPMV